jgi:predicted DCC family thiol-disulfide oxidoreductase YuxK
LTAQQAATAAWIIDVDGRRYAGAAAINRALEELHGGWPAISALYRFTPVRIVEDETYRHFARQRSEIARFIPKWLL